MTMTTPSLADIKLLAHDSTSTVVLAYLHQNILGKLGKDHPALQIINSLMKDKQSIKMHQIPIKNGYKLLINLGIVKNETSHEIDIPSHLEKDIISAYIFLLKAATLYWEEFAALNTQLISKLNSLTGTDFSVLQFSSDNSSLFFDPSFGYKITNISYYVDSNDKPLKSIEELQNIL